MRIRHRILLAVFLLSLHTLVWAQEVNYAIHANIIYRLTKYIDWPGQRKQGDFVIGVVSNTPLHDKLKSFVAGKKAGEQNIVVRKYSASEADYNCHILVVGEAASKNLKHIIDVTSSTPTLIVTEAEGLSRKGSCINIVIVDDHLQVEIHKENTEKRGLAVASELLALSKVVK